MPNVTVSMKRNYSGAVTKSGLTSAPSGGLPSSLRRVTLLMVRWRREARQAVEYVMAYEGYCLPSQKMATASDTHANQYNGETQGKVGLRG